MNSTKTCTFLDQFKQTSDAKKKREYNQNNLVSIGNKIIDLIYCKSCNSKRIKYYVSKQYQQLALCS